MAHIHLPSLAAALLLTLCGRPCTAAFISEVYLGADEPAGMPVAIELAELTGLSHVQLIVLDATPGRYGEVRQIVTVPVDHDVHLISERSWPASLWAHDPSKRHELILSQLHADDDAFDLRWPRTVRLYDRQTPVAVDGSSLFSAYQQQLLGDAVLLDELTLSFGDQVADEVNGPIVSVDQGEALARPYVAPDTLASALVQGTPTAEGMLARDYRLSPGWRNMVWPTPTPEPGTLGLLLVGAVVAGRRPPRRTRCDAAAGPGSPRAPDRTCQSCASRQVMYPSGEIGIVHPAVKLYHRAPADPAVAPATKAFHDPTEATHLRS